MALSALLTLWVLRALAQGPEAYARVLARLRAPGFVALTVLALAFVLFHAVTWFHLAPKAMVLRLGGKRLPDAVVVGLNYLAWVVLSAAAAWAILRG